MSMRDEWRYAMVMNGRRCVIMTGKKKRQTLFVDSWDIIWAQTIENVS